MMQRVSTRVQQGVAHWPYLPLLLLILGLCLGSGGMTGCGSGGEGGGDFTPDAPTTPAPEPPPPTPAPSGAVSGRLIVPPSSTLEGEPNHTLAQAQQLSVTSTVAGSAALPESGFFLPNPGVIVQDLYRVNAAGRVRITLAIAANNPTANDLDLWLMDSAGNFLDASTGITFTEVVETPGAGDFLIGVQAFQGASAYVLSLIPLGALSLAHTQLLPPEGEFVPGEILVKMRPGKVNLRQQATALANVHNLAHTASFPPDVALMQVSPPQQPLHQETEATKVPLPNGTTNAMRALTLETVQRLRMDPTVAYAEPNFLRHLSLTPTDEFFNLQWHYQLINLPAAWDMTTGSDSVIVALLDTGVLVEHPDLHARLTTGFDFISGVINANDGNGVDDNPNDAGDDPRHVSSSFHGTHVAGTIGAMTDNGAGVAGVTWQTRLMPLRVLGIQGGADADIAQAIRYAAGLSNSSGMLPAQRAHIINMSLGGPGFSQTLQDAVQAARAQGVILVAAAGNENTPILEFPASFAEVLSVAAVDLNSNKAPYSSFGSGIDVAAPGGDMRVDVNGDGFGDGVLSTLGNDRGEFLFRYYQGTSMAAPHVAGVLALMLAVNPNLTPGDIDLLLAGTHPATATRITRDLGLPGRDDFFGHGLIDAATAVAAARAVPGGSGISPGGSVLTASTIGLDFANFLSTLSLDITNAGAGTLRITEITDDAPWLTLTPSSGTAPLTVTAVADRAGLAAGQYSATIRIMSDASQGNATLTLGVAMQVGGVTVGNVGPVFVLVLDRVTFDTVQDVVTEAAQSYAFTTPPVPPGNYMIVAGTDRDNDGFICDPEDACGVFPEPVTLTTGQTIAGLEFVVGELVTPQSLAVTAPRLHGGRFARRR